MLDCKQEGTDSMLRSMVVTWKAEANGNDTGLLTIALLRTVLFVTEHMVQVKHYFFCKLAIYSFRHMG